MADDAQALEEVVVIGYGAVKRKDLTGSVATVNSEVLAAVPVASATEALTGKMAGVQITTTEGSPDAEMKSAYAVAVPSQETTLHYSLLTVSRLNPSPIFRHQTSKISPY